jgi:hypothetical protein
MVSLPIAMARGSASSASGLNLPAAEREYNSCDLFIAAVVAAASSPREPSNERDICSQI